MLIFIPIISGHRRSCILVDLIKSKMKVKAHVDAETGEVTKVKKSWWSFLASESDETEEPEETAEEQ